MKLFGQTMYNFKGMLTKKRFQKDEKIILLINENDAKIYKVQIT